MSAGATAAAEAHPRRKLLFFICAMALFMAQIDQTIVAASLQPIGKELHSQLNWVGWTITIYQLGQIIALPVAGKISDQFGRKKIFLGAVILFTCASLACGLSTSIYMLISLRFVQALGSGAFMPSASGIIADYFGRDRDRAIGMFSSISPIGGIAGPILGGVITQYWNWRGIFFVNLPIGVVLIVLAARFIPRAEPREVGRFDIPGVGLLAGTILTGMTAIALLGEHGMAITNFKVVVPAAVAVFLGWRFKHHAQHTKAPFIPLRLLQGKGFAVTNMLNFSLGTVVFGFSALLPLYAEQRYHLHISSAGTILSARAVGAIIIAAAATMMLRRTGYRLPMLVGFLAIAVSTLLLGVAPRGMPTYWWLALFATLTGLGIGCAQPAANNATIQLAPDHVAAIVGLRAMFRTTGGILFLSITTAVVSRSPNEGLTLAHVSFILGAVLVAVSGFISLVPDHRGRW